MNNKAQEIAISSRVRLARNFENYPFPFKMSNEKAFEIVEKVRRTNFEKIFPENKFNYLEMGVLDPIYKQALVERHLISRELLMSNKPSGLIVNDSENIGIMVNEEDHLRIQSIFEGFDLNNAKDNCMKVEELLEKDNKFAFNYRYGYLTTCPTNIGTGMRASVMLHLPALTNTGLINQVLTACERLGITVRGMYGENSKAIGNMYQISNQKTLGQTEEEIVNNVINISSQIIEQEWSLRRELYNQNKYKLEDSVLRAYGLLKYSRIITSEESLSLLSEVRLGVDMGIITELDRKKLNILLVAIQPGNMQKSLGRVIEPEQRDIHRANIIRAVLDNKI